MNETALDPELRTGDPVVDGQHEHLFSLSRELGEALVDDEDHLQLGHVIFGILHYTQTHFASEEALMERVGYPGLERQRVQHARFAAEAHRLAGSVLTAQATPAEFHEVLSGWLDEHVNGEDMQLADFIRAS